MIKKILLLITLSVSSLSFAEEIISEEEMINEIASTNIEYPHYEVGVNYLKNKELGVDFNKALFWLAQSSEVEEYEKADYLIAEMYSKGKTPSGIVDYEKALFFYNRSAQRGNTDAKLKLSMHYYFNDIVRDSDKALFWLQESIKDKDQTASLLYYLLSLQESDYEAIKKQLMYFELKAEKGDKDSNFALGYLYLTGKGVDRDLNIAKKHFIFAMNSGIIVSEIFLIQIDKLLLNK